MVAKAPDEAKGINVHRNLGVIWTGQFLDSKYLYHYLSSPAAQTQIKKSTKGGNQPLFNLKDLNKIAIALPSLNEQKEIVRRVESLFIVADQLEKKLFEAQKRIDHLTASILSKAFRGELVPQDPNDEPAEVLLKRIQTEREALAATKKKHRRAPKKRSGRGKKTQAQKAEAEAEPEPAAPKPEKTGAVKETDKAGKPRKQAHKPIEIRFEKADLLKAFRKAVFRHNGLDQDTLLRLVGRRLGVRRLSKPIRRELETAMRKALRRKIIAREGNSYYGATPTIHHYDDTELIKVLRSVIRKGYEYEREHLTTEAAAYLGFDKVSDAFAEKMKTVFRLAIRRGQLYRNGRYVGKV
jgi:type I restriction enzyme S subunit